MDENPYKPPQEPPMRWDVYCVDGRLRWCQVGPQGEPILTRPSLLWFVGKWFLGFFAGIGFGWCVMRVLEWASAP